jgi:hypothetical protein
MLEASFLPPAGSHPTYDSIYLRIQILSSAAFCGVFHFMEWYFVR